MELFKHHRKNAVCREQRFAKSLFARLHGKLWREGRITLQELARQLDRAVEAVAELRPLWSG